MLRSCWPIIALLLALLQDARCEIRPFNLLLDPASDYIHYVEGFLLTPGYIDLSDLRFWSTEETDRSSDNNAFAGEGDDKDDEADEEDEVVEGDDLNDDGVRRLEETYMKDGSDLDIATIRLPSKCANVQKGCDWTEMGIGKRSEEGIPYYCCSQEAMASGICVGTQFGRLIMDTDKFSEFSGKHRVVSIPANGYFESHLSSGRLEEKAGNGKYVVIFANCYDGGRSVRVEGKTTWKSRHGYLPGNLFGLMYFDAFLFLLYFCILLWYGITMKMYEDASIPIQTWIFGTIALGCLELFFRTGDYFVWNEDGSRFYLAFYIGVVAGVVKRGVSRCLIVMVALGWGVIRDSLGSVLYRINFLGGLYIATSLVCDIFEVVAYTEVQRINKEEEDELFDVVTILRIAVAVIDIIFYIWIIDSLNATMDYLESTRQSSKLQRYLRLRCIFLFSILFAVVWSVFGIVNSMDEGIVENEQNWVLDASAELNYIFVLLGVAILWRPSPTAKEYAFVMELPAMGEDDDEEDDEAANCVVPSAADDDDDDEEEVMFVDEPEVKRP